ncbi:hypothetical protein J2Z35_001358 [Acetoanaerobium pronyense]|uniref:Uncharacterized protein n=1 Tax=Acetoanaerobium pronyense TaxID=1482736 RepID=A0ABS4KK12_9FIRM|nr:hypothetical protein [Acetoanaerobium pronyense]MBP2027561.1 hypothetical protein [Acetoanaerobium pronyense]
MSLMNVAFSVSTFTFNLEIKKQPKIEKESSIEKIYNYERSLKSIENAKRLAQAEFSTFRY